MGMILTRMTPYGIPSPRQSLRNADYETARRILAGEAELWGDLSAGAETAARSAAIAADPQRLLSPGDYQEIAAEAMARCYAQLERYEGRSRFRRWVCGYAKNLTRNRCSRQLTAQRNQHLLRAAVRERGLCLDPLQILIRLERDQSLWAAFYALDNIQRIILQQRIFCNTAPKVLAKQLHLTRRQVLEEYDRGLFALRWYFTRAYF